MASDRELKRIFDNIIDQFGEKGVLNDVMLAGSWCQHVYKENLKSTLREIPDITTMDIDFLIPNPYLGSKEINVAEIIKSNDFEVKQDRMSHTMAFIRGDYKIEFITPNKRRVDFNTNTNLAYEVKKLKINAQGISYLDYLTKNSEIMKYRGHSIRVPKPEIFALHKMFIASKRGEALEKKYKGEDLTKAEIHAKHKAEKDRASANAIFDLISTNDDQKRINNAARVLSNMSNKIQILFTDQLKVHAPDMYEKIKFEQNKIELHKYLSEEPEWHKLSVRGKNWEVFGRKSYIKKQHSFVDEKNGEYIPKLKSKTGKIIKISTPISLPEVAKNRAEKAYNDEYSPKIKKLFPGLDL